MKLKISEKNKRIGNKLDGLVHGSMQWMSVLHPSQQRIDFEQQKRDPRGIHRSEARVSLPAKGTTKSKSRRITPPHARPLEPRVWMTKRRDELLRSRHAASSNEVEGTQGRSGRSRIGGEKATKKGKGGVRLCPCLDG